LRLLSPSPRTCLFILPDQRSRPRPCHIKYAQLSATASTASAQQTSSGNRVPNKRRTPSLVGRGRSGHLACSNSKRITRSCHGTPELSLPIITSPTRQGSISRKPYFRAPLRLLEKPSPAYIPPSSSHPNQGEEHGLQTFHLHLLRVALLEESRSYS